MGLINRGTAAKRYKVTYEELKRLGDWGAVRVEKRGRYYFFDREELEGYLKKRRMGIYRSQDYEQQPPTPKEPAPAPGRPEPKPSGDDKDKTKVTNSCGHVWSYRIRRPSAIKWLEGRPCPPCARKGEKPKDGPNLQPMPAPEDIPIPDPIPDPEPVPEIDQEFVSAVLKRLPEAALYHASLPDLTLLLKAGVPVWLQGPPGTSKSTLAQQAATALELSFHPISCHEMMTRTDLFGYRDAVGAEHRTPMWDAYENGGVLLLDEVDNGNPNLLAALNSALSNGHCVFGSGTLVERHPDFRVVATANTAGLGPEDGFIGRLGVDLATRDRFVTVMINIDDHLEAALASLYSGDEESVGKARSEFRNRAKKIAERRSIEVQRAPSADQIVGAVRTVRKRAAAQFRGLIVSPRTTIHVAAMTRVGFTLAEALEAKLTGLKPDEVAGLCRDL